MPKTHDLIEVSIAEDLKELIRREVTKLVNKVEFDKNDFIALEKLTKTYSLIMSDLRETVKAGLFADLPDELLEGLVADKTKPQEKSPRGRGKSKI